MGCFSTPKNRIKTRGIPQSRETFAEHFKGNSSLYENYFTRKLFAKLGQSFDLATKQTNL